MNNVAEKHRADERGRADRHLRRQHAVLGEDEDEGKVGALLFPRVRDRTSQQHFSARVHSANLPENPESRDNCPLETTFPDLHIQGWAK